MTNLKNDGPCFVYGIFDPRSGTVFYVGTSISPERRLPAHRHDPGSAAFKRSHQIIRQGFEPQLIVLAKCQHRNHALYVEHRLMLEFPALLNRARDLYQITGKYSVR
jgi:predicted GIY-YIG superfamily endonuclease